MPRLPQVPWDEAPEGIVTDMYDFIFGDRDPVAEPGLPNGTTGDWWTVMALSPEALAHSVQGFRYYRSPDPRVDLKLRELAQLRVGWARQSRFVFSQHAKASRDNGLSEEEIASVVAWQTSDVYTPAQRAVLAWTDALVLGGGRADDATFAALRAHLSDVAVLELTYIATMYDQHAIMAKALRLELDDVDDRITEVTGPGIAMTLRPER